MNDKEINFLEKCKWCIGTGDDGSGVCPDCECTGYLHKQYAIEKLDEMLTKQYEVKGENKMTERVETVQQLMEILSKQHPNKPVKLLAEEDDESKVYRLYVETNSDVILFK